MCVRGTQGYTNAVLYVHVQYMYSTCTVHVHPYYSVTVHELHDYDVMYTSACTKGILRDHGH